jgi:hypothetical protein
MHFRQYLQESLELPDVLYTVEFIDRERLYALVNTREEHSPEVSALLGAARFPEDSSDCVVYLQWRRSGNAPGFGRYFSPGSLIRQKGSHRALLAGNRYIELDLRASNPTILMNVMREEGRPMPCLRHYIFNRESVHSEFRSLCPPGLWREGLAKEFVNASINGSQEIWTSVVRPFMGEVPFFADLYHELQAALFYVFSAFPEVPFKNSARTKYGSRMANLLLTLETHAVLKVIDSLRDGDLITMTGSYTNVGYAYDGLLIPRSCDLDSILVCSNTVLDGLGYRDLQMRYKPLKNPVQVVDIVDDVCRVPALSQFGSQKLAIAYPTGCGKTFQAVNYAIANYRYVLIIVHRQTLAMNIKRQYAGFDCYLATDDAERCLNADRQIVCINSLGKLAKPNIYQCIIVDEVCSQLDQIVDMHLGPVEWEMMRLYLTSPTRKVICMDALITESDMDVLCSAADYELVSPTRLQRFTRTCTILRSGVDAFGVVRNFLEEGKSVCVPYTANVAKIDGILAGFGVPYLNVNRYTKLEERNAIGNWINYPLVAFSPTMDAGVDVTFRGDDGEILRHFDAVVGVFVAITATPSSCIQMLGRIRNCSTFYIAVDGHSSRKCFDGVNRFESFLKNRIQRIADLGLNFALTDDFSPVIARDFRFNVTWRAVNRRSESSSGNFDRVLKRYLILNQWAVITVDDDIEDASYGLHLQGLKAAGERAELCAIASSQMISPRTADRYRGQGDLPLSCHRALVAYDVLDAFGLTRLRPHVQSYPGFDARNGQNSVILLRWQESLLSPDGDHAERQYIKRFFRDRTKYYRTKQLVDIEMGVREPSLEFFADRPSFNETTLVVLGVLRKLGFATLDTTVTDLPDENTLQRTLKLKTSLATFLLETCGLRIDRVEGQARLVSMIASADHTAATAFFIPALTISYLGAAPHGFQFVDTNKVKCIRCFKPIRWRGCVEHTCRRLPDGMCYVEIEGTRHKWCNICNRAVDRNAARHAARHFN